MIITIISSIPITTAKAVGTVSGTSLLSLDSGSLDVCPAAMTKNPQEQGSSALGDNFYVFKKVSIDNGNVQCTILSLSSSVNSNFGNHVTHF